VDCIPKISEKLKRESRPVYIHSLGGLGKSTVAKAFCHKETGGVGDFEYVFWVDVRDSHNDVRRDLMKNPLFEFSVENEDNKEESIERDFARFVKETRHLDGLVLLVIDNVTEPSQIRCIDRIAGLLGWKILATSRAKLEDPSFEKRLIELTELETEHCRELFYTYYEDIDENKAADELLLQEIFKAVRYHTQTIKLLALVGNENDCQVSEMLQMLEEKGFEHSDLWLSVEDQYTRLSDIIQAIFDISSLTPEEQQVLFYFSILPDRPIPEATLLRWMVGDNQDEQQMKTLFAGLARKGWLDRSLEISREGRIRAYKCHNTIQSALRPRIEDVAVATDGLVKGMAAHISIEPYEDYEPLLPYFDCVWAVVKGIDGVNTPVAFKLKKAFLKLLNKSNSFPDDALILAEGLEENFMLVRLSLSEQEHYREQIDSMLACAQAYIEASQDEGRYEKVLKMRTEARDLASKYLRDTDALYWSAQHMVARSLRRGRTEESIELFIEIVEKLKEKIAESAERGTETSTPLWYALNLALQGLGLSNTRLMNKRRQEGDTESAREICRANRVIREDLVVLVKERLGKANRSYTAALNDLGMTYGFLYEYDEKDPWLLEEAMRLLSESRDIKMTKYGEQCAAVATALQNIGFILALQKDYDEAIENIKKALSIRQQILGNIKSRSYFTVYRRLGKTLYWRWLDMRQEEDFVQAKAAYRRALDHLEHFSEGLTDDSSYLMATKELEDMLKAHEAFEDSQPGTH
jgi:tetratricopeptide (TPR) repeat protein